MSLTKATYSMIKGAPLNLLDFGADPTGVASSQAAFDLALTQAVATGQSIYAPSGTYLLNSMTLTNGSPVGNGNKYGQTIYGDGVGKTFFKASGSSNKFLSLLGVVGIYFYTRFRLQDFTIDMASMTNAATSMGIYGIFAYGGNVANVDVINKPASAYSLYLDQGCYTTVWTNCDFGGVDGLVRLQGFGTQSVTTQTFVGSSWGKIIADNCSAISILSCIVQGDLTPKFVLSEQYGLYISGGDFEGSGVLYAFGTNVNQFTSIGNALVGFSGNYYTGTPTASAGVMLLDQVYPVTSSGNPFIINNQAVTSAAALSGFTAALNLNGTVGEYVAHEGITRKVIQNSSPSTSSVVDINFSNLNGDTYVGMDINGDSYLDGRGTTEVTLNQNGTKRVGVASTGALYINTTTAPTAGSIVGYLTFTNGTTTYKIPYYANA
jgi:hypothetical protein